MNPMPSPAARAGLLMALFTSLAPALSAQVAQIAQIPVFADSGFVLETVASLPANEPVGMTWGPDGAMYVWQENGVVRVVKDGVVLPDPFLDLRGKVNTVNDRGLLRFRPRSGLLRQRLRLSALHLRGKRDAQRPRSQDLAADPRHRRSRQPPHGRARIRNRDARQDRPAPCHDLPAGSDCIGSDSHSHSVGTLPLRQGRQAAGQHRRRSQVRSGTPSPARPGPQPVRRQDPAHQQSDGSAPGDNPVRRRDQSIRSKVYAYGCATPTVSPSSRFPGTVHRRRGLEPPRGDQFRQGRELRLALLRRAGSRRTGVPGPVRGMPPIGRGSVTFAVYTPTGVRTAHSAIGGAFLSAATITPRSTRTTSSSPTTRIRHPAHDLRRGPQAGRRDRLS